MQEGPVRVAPGINRHPRFRIWTSTVLAHGLSPLLRAEIVVTNPGCRRAVPALASLVRPKRTTALPAPALVLWELGDGKERQTPAVTGSLDVSWLCFANGFCNVSWAIH